MSTGLVNVNQTAAAIKKLFGKAHTSAVKGLINEEIPSGVPISAAKVFAQEIPNNPGANPSVGDIYTDTNGNQILERVKLDLSSLSGTTYDADSVSDANKKSAGAATSNAGTFLNLGTGTSAAGPHGYKASLPSTYESTTSNLKKGNGVFDNGKNLFETLGLLQAINPGFSTAGPNPYDPILRSGTTDIPVTDPIDFIFDTYAGIVFVQDYQTTKVPDSIECWIYIGDMVTDSLSNVDAAVSFISSGSVSASMDVGDQDIFKITSASNDLVRLSTDGGEVNFNIDGNLVANKYIVSSSVTFMTTSFSEGNTAFGDSLTDTHQFTGSLTFTGSATYATMSNATYSEIAYQDARGGLKFSHVIDGGSF